MFRSVFLRRIILIMLIALCLCAIIASVLFVFASSNTLQTNLKDSMADQAYAIASSDAEKILLKQDPDALNALMADKEIIGLYVLILDNNGKVKVQSKADNSKDTLILNHLTTYLEKNHLSQSDEMIEIRMIPSNDNIPELMVIQVPVKSNGEIIGHVALANPMTEISTVQTHLFEIILLATLVVSFIMLIPIFLATSRLVRPLHQVILAARTMGQGDLTARASVKTRGEIGELAQAFNDLADKLSASITELTTERNRLLEIFDVLSDGVVSVDLNCNPIYSNPAINTTFESERRRGGLTGNMHLIPFEEIWANFKLCIQTKELNRNKIQSRDKTYIYRIVPTLDSNDILTGATGFFRDISETERLEQTRREYVANVSHELRTPLTALQGLIEPLADGMITKEADRMRYYGIILHETIRLSRLINDLLELSSLQSKSLGFETDIFNLNELLENLELRFKTMVHKADLTLNLEFHDGPSPLVEGNEDRIEQIIVILLDNATKYTPSGTITIFTELSEDKKQVLVSVRDTGIGIEEKDLEYIFDRFYKADRARGKKGTGLGLAIAKELLNYMGEDITVQSEYGKGTTFTFTLKCHNEEEINEEEI